MKQRTQWFLWMALPLVLGLAVGGCSKKQLREEGAVGYGGGQSLGTDRAGFGRGTARSDANVAQSPGDTRVTGSPGAVAPGGPLHRPLVPPPSRTFGTELPGGRAIVGHGLAGETLQGLSRIYFEFDRATLTSQSRDTLTKNAQYLEQNPETRIRVEGHCDERGTSEYNLALGDRRAMSAVRYLTDLGISPNRLRAVSYGKEVPIDPRHTEDAWAKNRRAEFIVIRN